MGRNIRFWIASGIKNDNVLTPTTLTIHTDAGMIAVIEVRPPVWGEQGWQCWPDLPLVDQVREMLADWGGDPPGWTATRHEDNGNHEGCFYITVLAAFDLDPGVPAVRHSLNPIKLQAQAPPSKYRYDWSGNDPRRNAAGMVPGGEARAANAHDTRSARIARASHAFGPGREISMVADEALEAFWGVVASCYAATSGDLAPEADIPLRRAAGEAIKAWVATNLTTVAP